MYRLTLRAVYIVFRCFQSDLEKAVSYARAHPELTSEGSAAMYGMAAKIPDNVLLVRSAFCYRWELGACSQV
jgi:hypothetical protein